MRLLPGVCARKHGRGICVAESWQFDRAHVEVVDAGQEKHAADPCAGRGSAVTLVRAVSPALVESGGGVAEEDPAPAHIGVGRGGLGLGHRLAEGHAVA